MPVFMARTPIICVSTLLFMHLMNILYEDSQTKRGSPYTYYLVLTIQQWACFRSVGGRLLLS